VPEIVGNIFHFTRTLTASPSPQKLVNDGGKTVVVSGIPPLGCAAGNLANQTGAEVEPRTGCLKDLNLLSKNHNRQLRRALRWLRARHPGVRLIYADFYAPIVDFATSPDRYGFNGTDGNGALKACCPGGTTSTSPRCAACPAYVDWDGVHLTEAANRRIADGWLGGPYAHSPILSTN